MTLYCPNCNHEFAPDDRHCANCGMERPAAIQKMPTMILNQGQPVKNQAASASSPEPLIPAAEVAEKHPKLTSPAELSMAERNAAPVVEEAPAAEETDEEITDPSMPSFWKCSQCVSLNPSSVDYCEYCGA